MRSGTFVLADIGGYTSFLTEVGIEHAKEITGHLLNGMFEVDRENWKLGDVEGDCLFLFRDSEVDSEELFAYLRRLYEQFRDSLEEIVSGSTCRCGACDRSGDLTLKFVVHAGPFDVEQIAGQRQLIGADVVVAHRLLKNSVPVREYLLLTDSVGDLARASGLVATRGRDEYDDLGAVDYRYLDLAPVRDAFHRSREIFLTEEDADVAVSVEIDAPPDRVWSIANDPVLLTRIFPSLVEIDVVSGKIEDVGSVHTCLHGDQQQMVHYRVAFDEAGRRATDHLSNVYFIGRLIQTWQVRASGTGSIFSFLYSIDPRTPIPDEAARTAALAEVRRHAEGDARGMKDFCERERRDAGRVGSEA